MTNRVKLDAYDWSKISQQAADRARADKEICENKSLETITAKGKVAEINNGLWSCLMMSIVGCSKFIKNWIRDCLRTITQRKIRLKLMALRHLILLWILRGYWSRTSNVSVRVNGNDLEVLVSFSFISSGNVFETVRKLEVKNS
jgi:hypothetical protein